MSSARSLRAGIHTLVSILMLLAAASAHAGTVYVARIDGAITSGTADFLQLSIERAASESGEAFVLELDTPGGELEATKRIVSSILNAQVPVIVFVSPRGAWAASAGTFITLAGHVAAMAPGTTIGAAHPVGLGGQDPGGPLPPLPSEDSDEESDDPPRERKNFIGQKIENMTIAFAESIAQERGRNVEFAINAVRDSIAVGATEAVEKNVVDLLAQDLDDLLRKVDGREVRVGSETRKLQLLDYELERLEMTLEERMLAFLTSPVVALGLLMLGLGGLYVEFTNPGGILPGIGGALCLVLAVFAFQWVPFNPWGVALILLGVVFMGSEAFTPTFGVLFTIGACTLGFGGYLLFDVPELAGLAPSFWKVIFPIVLAMVALGGVMVFLVSRSLFLPVFAGSGPEGLVGQTAVVESRIDPRGRIKLQGELWNAEAAEPIEPGTRVRIVAVHDLVVSVAPVKNKEEA